MARVQYRTAAATCSAENSPSVPVSSLCVPPSHVRASSCRTEFSPASEAIRPGFSPLGVFGPGGPPGMIAAIRYQCSALQTADQGWPVSLNSEVLVDGSAREVFANYAVDDEIGRADQRNKRTSLPVRCVPGVKGCCRQRSRFKVKPKRTRPSSFPLNSRNSTMRRLSIPSLRAICDFQRCRCR